MAVAEAIQRNGGQAGLAVETRGLSKSFGQLSVINGVDLEIERGTLLGLIGPSGCGKTTLVRLMAGLAKPSKGAVRLLGVDPLDRTAEQRELSGYMPQGSFLFPNLTVTQNARFVAGLYGIGWLRRRQRIREMLERVELWDARKRLTKQLSGGMQRRLALACAVLHHPAIVFVDEPTVGLDPILRESIWDYLHGLRSQGVTIIVTTQYVEEAAHCDTVALMRAGAVVLTGTPEELRQQAFPGDMAEIEGGPFGRLDVEALEDLDSVRRVERFERGLRITVDELTTATPQITRVLQQRGTNVHSVTPQLPTFDEVFTELVERDGRND